TIRVDFGLCGDHLLNQVRLLCDKKNIRNPEFLALASAVGINNQIARSQPQEPVPEYVIPPFFESHILRVERFSRRPENMHLRNLPVSYPPIGHSIEHEEGK